MNMLRRLIGEQVELVWLPGQDLGRVQIDPAQLDQVLVNLCLNARDAIVAAGRVTIRTADAVARRGLLRRPRGLHSGSTMCSCR